MAGEWNDEPSEWRDNDDEGDDDYEHFFKMEEIGADTLHQPVTDARRNEMLCPFAMAGHCRYGDTCRYLHGLACPSCSKHVLHPYHTPTEHDEHISQCLARQAVITKQRHKANQVACGICHERVAAKSDSRFGLLNCEHAFCLSCIRHYRQTSTTSQHEEAHRTCPLCGTMAHFITPTPIWPVDLVERQQLVEEYRRKLSTIPCKHFDYGDKYCPFGESCFYAHTDRQGNHLEARRLPTRTRSHEDGDKSPNRRKEISLVDLLDVKRK
jgi:E3 ubiquitin-protein ligase makorin